MSFCQGSKYPIVDTYRRKGDTVMTKVIFEEIGQRYFFEVSGHAVTGEDVEAIGEGEAVCAALSILILCAASRISEMDSRGDLISSHVSVESGYACFDIEPREDVIYAVKEMFDILLTGITLLEENFPALVCIE